MRPSVSSSHDHESQTLSAVGRARWAIAVALPVALTAAFPAVASAHGGGAAAPAGGGALTQVVAGTIGGALILAGMLFVVVGHRRGTVDLAGRLAAVAERRTGLPGWASLPLAVLGGSLIIAVFGMYWDIATHLDAGRDEGPFANASHYFILAGLFGIFFAGLLAIFLPEGRPGRAAVRIREGWYAPLGGLLILVCAGFALSGFPLDDMWHRIFGQDVTLWGPTHLLLFGGASLSTLAGLILLVEGGRARDVRAGGPGAAAGKDDPAEGRGIVPVRVLQAMLAGAFLIGLSTFQGEFDYAVPQFRLVWHPILLMLASSIALVTARIYVGRGGALYAVAMFLAVRGVLTLLVSPTFGHTTLHFPLYIVEALVVEAVALRVPRERPVALGAMAGLLIGTVGLAAEWGWSYVWWTIEWPASMLPEAAVTGLVTAVAGGVIGGFIGRALTAPEIIPRAMPRLALPAALVAIVAVLAYATPISDGDPVSATVTLEDVVSGPERAVNARVELDPPDAADDARWFNTTAWQGEEGRSVVAPLEEVAPGVYETTEPLPVHGNWKSTIRLHQGTAVQGLAVYFPPDEAIPVEGIPAEATFTRDFVRDVDLLQREKKPGVSGALVAFAYITVLIIGLGLYASMGWGLRLLQRRLAAKPSAARAAGEAAS
jgi:hypothetical protein